MTETNKDNVAEAFFFQREDDLVCFHVNDIHVAILDEEEAAMLVAAMQRDGSWKSTKFAATNGSLGEEIKV